MANITRIKNNQITDNTIEYQKIKSGTLVGTNFNANLTLNSNVTILGNLTVANSFAQLNSINTYINDPLVVFNNNYTGSPTYDIGMLINRNLSSLAPYGAVNAAFVWKETDAAFEALMTTESGTTAGSINNSGWANLRAGNVTATTITVTNALTAGLASFASINGTPIGNATPSTGNFTTLVATNFSTGNAVISGGYISALTNATITTSTLTNLTVTNFYTANARIQGGYIQNLANVTAALGYVATLNATNGNVTTLQVNNLNSGNAAITGGQTYIGTGAQLIANVYAGTGYYTNLSSGNAVITGAQTYIGTGGALIANVYASTGYFSNFSTPNLSVTTENVTTLYAQNFSSPNAAITGAQTYIGTGGTLIANTYVTTAYATNFSSPNIVVSGGSINNVIIGNTTQAAANVTTLNASGGVLFTNTTTATTTATGALVVSGGIGVAKDSFFGGNINIAGNLTVTGNSVSIASSSLTVNDPIINLHSPPGLLPLTTNDGADIGIKMHYYDTADSAAFVGRANDTGYLEWYARGTDSGNVFTGTAYGTIKTGELLLANSTATTGPTTGALRVTGGVGIGGDLYAYKLNATHANITTGYFGSLNTANAQITGGTITGLTNLSATTLATTNFSSGNAVITGGSINGTVIGNTTAAAGRFTTVTTTSVVTAAGNIVANSNTVSLDTTTGAVVITGFGGLAVGGNIHAGVYNTSLHNIRGNLLLGLGEDQANDSALTINLNNDAPILSNATVHLSGAVGKDAVYGADSFGAGLTSTFAARHARGTPGSPSAVQANDPLGGFTARGYGTTGYNLDQDRFGSGMAVYANENFTDTNQGTYVTIQAVPDGTIDSIFGLIVGGNSQVIVPGSITSTSPTTGALVVPGGGLGVFGNVNVGATLRVTGLSFFSSITTVNANLVAASQTNSTSSTTGALTVVGGTGIMANVFVGGASTFGSNRTAGFDTVTQGKNDATLIWARSGNTYDQVVIGNSATTSTLVTGAKLIVNSTDSMIIPVGTNAQRPDNVGGTAVLGMLRYNTTTSAPEYYDGTAWTGFATNLTVITDEQFNGDGVTVDFTLAQPTTTASTIVSINGVLQIPTLAYSCSGTTLTFTEAPAVGDVIDVRRLVTTSVVSSLASVNGYMQVETDNNGVRIYTGVTNTSITTYWEPNGAQVASSANVAVATANALTAIDSFSSTTYRSAVYQVQVTRGTAYQVQTVTVLHDGANVTAVTHGIVQTSGNLGVFDANIVSNTAYLNFIPSGSSSIVRMKKDYILI